MQPPRLARYILKPRGPSMNLNRQPCPVQGPQQPDAHTEPYVPLDVADEVEEEMEEMEEEVQQEASDNLKPAPVVEQSSD